MRLFRGLYFILKTVWTNNKRYYLYFILDVIRRTINPILLMYFPKLVIDSLINNNYSLAMIFILSLAFSTFMIEIIGHQLQQKNILIEQDIESSISMSLSEKVMTLQYERLESKAKLDEYQFAKQCLANGGITKFTNMIVIIVSSIMTITSIIFIVMKLNDWVIYLIMIVTIINMVCEIKRVNYEYHITQKGAVIERNLYYARDELTRNAYAKEVHLFQLSPFIQSKIKYYLEAFSNLQKESATKTVKLFGWTYIVSGIQMLVTYGYLVIICFKREISIGDFSLYITAMTTFCSVLSMIIRTLMEIVSQNKYLVALVNFLEQNEEWEQKELMTLPQDLESITFEGVTFQYPKAEEVSLEDFTFCFKQGKKYSIVGANGAGKTTLIKLMLGFYTPQKGEIKANNINVRHFKYKDYMKLFAPVFQDFNILGYSIAENIAMNTQIEDEKVYKVIEKVGLKSKINKLRNNIKTPMNRELNTEGTEFSIGQQQKLALARALYKQAPVYILDEPTAALSPQAEYDLYQKFEKITKNKMVFYISHRLSSCKLCDQIIVLDKGKIVEYGTWMELMDKRGLFYEMFLVQAEQFK